jgi:hypothetical protein
MDLFCNGYAFVSFSRQNTQSPAVLYRTIRYIIVGESGILLET